ncbi:MAG: nicotinate-nucleotide--dimethylbenzimidazole phosphoribosyltransferase [Sandaracinus sp.]|nr:nicotinate-nucleotide--dimethylbenzimidazole phosphoribosyltransferase [Sandaracinus sp.]
MIPPLDEAAADAARAHQARLTKPTGALGRLERLVAHLAGIQGVAMPSSRPAACLLFASDHPVTKHGVSAYPSEVTAAMVANFVGTEGRPGGAAASVLCRTQNVALHVHDVGVLRATPGVPRARSAELPAGDLRVEDAMPRETFEAAWEAGRDAVRTLDPQPRVLVLGEMGIGNTTPASVVSAALLGVSAEAVVGRGTGVDDEGRARKLAVVREALARVTGDEPLEVLRRGGGRELVALAGAAHEAASRRIAVLVDGFIVSAALLALVRHEPTVLPYLVPAHRSREPGHRAVLEALFGAAGEPLLDLDLALGEGSGALTALPLVDLALATHAQMATFESAGVPDRE